MADPFDYISAIRNRLLLLIERFAPDLAARPANISQRNDARRFGLMAKPQTGITSDFPQIEVTHTDTEDGAYDPTDESRTLNQSDEPPDEYAITQTYLIKIIHDDANAERNAKESLRIQQAIRKGGRRLADPDTADSELDFVIGWGPVTARRQTEWVKTGVRDVTRISYPVAIVLYNSETETP